MGNCPEKEAALRSRSRLTRSWVNWDADRSVHRPGDCCVRAISVVSKRPYEEVYNDLYQFTNADPGYGVVTEALARYLRKRGFFVRSLFHKQVELATFIPKEPRVVIFLRDHATAMINGHIVDTFNPLDRPKMHRVHGYAVPR